jgi:hypothetical protein
LRLPETPISEEDLPPVPADEEIKEEDRIVYQQKFGSILCAAVVSRPDISFSAAHFTIAPAKPTMK